jgi:hypothetical protein
MWLFVLVIDSDSLSLPWRHWKTMTKVLSDYGVLLISLMGYDNASTTTTKETCSSDNRDREISQHPQPGPGRLSAFLCPYVMLTTNKLGVRINSKPF